MFMEAVRGKKCSVFSSSHSAISNSITSPKVLISSNIFKNIDYPRLCHYPCLLARCPANNAKEENVKLIEISFVSWFSSLLGQAQKAAEIIKRSKTHSMVHCCLIEGRLKGYAL